MIRITNVGFAKIGYVFMPMLSRILTYSVRYSVFGNLLTLYLSIYAAVESVQREVADPGKPGDIGAPMPGVIVEVRVQRKQS